MHRNLSLTSAPPPKVSYISIICAGKTVDKKCFPTPPLNIIIEERVIVSGVPKYSNGMCIVVEDESKQDIIHFRLKAYL